MEKAGKGRVRYLSDKEFKDLYSVCEDWLKSMVLVAVYTGIRQGNLLSLTWDDVDLFRKIIILKETKNGESQGIPICKPLQKLFVQLNKVRQLKSFLVFPNPDGSRIIPMRLQRAFKRACERAGIEDFRWHDLRHQFASKLVQNGVDLFKVQKLLGHKDARMTQRYAHLAPENLRDAVNVFENVGHNLDTVDSLETKEGGVSH